MKWTLMLVAVPLPAPQVMPHAAIQIVAFNLSWLLDSRDRTKLLSR
jgi:hypothetical protein